MTRMRMAVATVAFLAAGAASTTSVYAVTIYNSIPDPLPQDLPSVAYYSNAISEFGDYIRFSAGSSRDLTNVTINLANWSYESTYEALGTSPGFSVPMTLTLYNPADGSTTPATGTAIAARSITALIPWRPEPSGGCSNNKYSAGAACWSGLGTNVTFNFSGVTVPDAVIYGLAFNTQSYGSSPTRSAGPYDALNFGLNISSGPSIGTDVNPDAVEFNTSNALLLTSPGPGIAGKFGPDTGWSGDLPAARFDAAVPEPGSLALLASSLGLGFWVRRRPFGRVLPHRT